MATNISNGTTTVTPQLVEGYQTTRASRTILHAIIGSNQPAVTLRAAALRTGNLRALFTTETGAQALVTMLAAGSVLTLADTDRPTIGMSFVVSGDITFELDDETRDDFWVDFEYSEVAP